MPLPSLPFELTEKILERAVEDLVDDERHDATITGLANTFLLAASPPRSNGLLYPRRADRFIAELHRAGLKETLTAVRIGVPSNVTPEDDATEGHIGMTKRLLFTENLLGLELVGSKLILESLRHLDGKLD